MDSTFDKETSRDWTCGGATMRLISRGVDGYDIFPQESDEDSNSPCYRITINRDYTNAPLVKTTILANGYNICKKDNIRTVERQIKIEYSE